MLITQSAVVLEKTDQPVHVRPRRRRSPVRSAKFLRRKQQCETFSAPSRARPRRGRAVGRGCSPSCATTATMIHSEAQPRHVRLQRTGRRADQARSPSPTRRCCRIRCGTGVGNVLGNLGDPWVALNKSAARQGRRGHGRFDALRAQHTWGLLGLLDIAGEAGLPKTRRGPRARRSGAGAWARAPTSCCPSSVQQPCVMRSLCPPTASPTSLSGIDPRGDAQPVLGTRRQSSAPRCSVPTAPLRRRRSTAMSSCATSISNNAVTRSAMAAKERVYEDFDEQSAAPPGATSIRPRPRGQEPRTAGHRCEAGRRSPTSARQSVQ